MEALAKEGFHTATLWAVSDNERARRFYDRLGWLPDGVVRSEKLSVGSEGGDVVEVSRFRHELSGSAGGR
jgi:RimJ/RimL family protein N-acetyltransferase